MSTASATTTRDLAHDHREHLESLHHTLRLVEREEIRAMARENADHAAWLAVLIEKAKSSPYPWPKGRRARISAESLATRLVLEEEWEAAIGMWQDRVFDSLDIYSAYYAATWMKKSRGAAARLVAVIKRDPGAIYLPDSALPQTVAALLDDYRDASPQMKPIVAAQIAATTGGLDPQQATTALMNTLQEFTAPTRQSVAEGLTGGLGAEFWATNGAQVYLQMAMQTSQQAGQASLKHMGIGKTFEWANPVNTARDMFAVRGSKVIQGLYGEHVKELTSIIVEATNPRAPLTVQQVEARIKERWPKLKKWQAVRIARTETAAVWTATSMNTYAANGVSHWESTIAHGPSIGIENSAPCPLCIELAADIHVIGAGDLPPWHPGCRCEAIPILEDPDTGEPWLPPDEPWTGGGDIPVCGTAAAFKARRQRTRLEGMRYVRIRKNVACLTPAPLPGEPYGGVKYNVLSVATMDADFYGAQIAHLRSQIQKEWVLGNTAKAATEIIDGVKTNTFNALWVARDAKGTPLSIAHTAEGEGLLVVQGLASKAGGNRHTVKRLAADAYSKGWDIMVRNEAMTPQLRKSLDEWGFKPTFTGSSDLRLAHSEIPEDWVIKPKPVPEPIVAPEPTPAPVEYSPPEPIAPPAAETLATTSDEIEALLKKIAGRINNYKYKLKQQQIKGADVDDIAATHVKILELQAQQAELKAQLKGAPSKPVVEQPKVETPTPAPEPLVEPIVPPKPVKPTEVESNLLEGDAAARALEDTYGAWGTALEPERVGALHAYASVGSGQKINDLLRSGMKERNFKYERITTSTPETLQPVNEYAGRYRSRLDATIDTSPQIEHNLVLWGEIPKEGIKAGRTYTEKAYLDGYTHSPSRLVSDDYREEMFVEIHVSAGMKGAWTSAVPNVADARYIMPRGLKLKIKRIEERTIDGQKRKVAVAEITNGPRPPLKAEEVHVTPPSELAVTPGGISKVKGTQDLIKKIQNSLGSGAATIKSEIMINLAVRVKGKPGWEPEAVNKAFNFSGHTRYSTDPDENVIAQLIHNWAISSSDADARAVAIQIAAKEELGLNVNAFAAAYWKDPIKNAEVVAKAEELLAVPGVRSSLRMFIRAQYEETQRFLHGIGVDEVTVYRGMRVSSSEAPWGPGISTIEVIDNPLASWSAKHSISRRFYGGTMLRSEVPREMILSTPITGFGCSGEYELVVLNAGRNSAWVSQTGTIKLTEAELIAMRREADDLERAIAKLQQESESIATEAQPFGSMSWQERQESQTFQELERRGRAVRADIYNLQSRRQHLTQEISQGGRYWSYSRESDLKEALKVELDKNPSLAGETRPKPKATPKAPRGTKPSAPQVPGTAGVTFAQAKNRVKNLTYKLYVERKKVPLDEAKVAQIEAALNEAKDLVASMTTKSRLPRLVIRLRSGR